MKRLSDREEEAPASTEELDEEDPELDEPPDDGEEGCEGCAGSGDEGAGGGEESGTGTMKRSLAELCAQKRLAAAPARASGRRSTRQNVEAQALMLMAEIRTGVERRLGF